MLAFLFSPSGRIGRAKWWLAQLPIIFIAIIILLLTINLTSGVDVKVSDANLTVVLAAVVLAIAVTWMSFCAISKRYHDRNKSAWWYLMQFIPLIGPIWQFVELGFCSGDDGDNDYGPGTGFDIGADIENLRKAQQPAQAYAAAPVYQAAKAGRSNGPPVFGKRG
jgi:uncharacterized membrane protein YhaH (DUF805 family)